MSNCGDEAWPWFQEATRWAEEKLSVATILHNAIHGLVQAGLGEDGQGNGRGQCVGKDQAIGKCHGTRPPLRRCPRYPSGVDRLTGPITSGASSVAPTLVGQRRVAMRFGGNLSFAARKLVT